MRSMRRPLTILALSVVLAIPAAAAPAVPLTRPGTQAFDLESVLAAAWSTVQGFVDKILATGSTGGDDGTTSTTQSTPTSGTGTPPDGSTDNGPGIDPNG